MKVQLAILFFASMLVYKAVTAQNSITNSKNNQTVTKYQINISKEKIADLNNRIANTRWINEVTSTGWGDPALDFSTVKDLTNYWMNGFDWKRQETYINSFPQFKALVKNINIHFVHQKGISSKTPILLLHGWGSNFTEYLKTAELLKKENPEVDVIIPSIPGFGFSDVPESMASEANAEYLHQLMTEILGYKSYFVVGNDYGAFIGEKMALKYPQSVVGLHLADIPFYHLYTSNDNLSQAENDHIQKINDWSMRDGAYGMIQGTKPKTLSTALNDSPVALAAWMLQLYFDFGDKKKPVFERYSKDDLLVNICLYWYTESIYSSIRLYSEDMSGFDEKPVAKVTVPVAFNFHEFDISGFVPREFAERFFSNIVSWTEFKEGGHFSGLSHPQQLKNDLIKFIKQIEQKTK